MTADWTDRIGHAALQVEVPWTPERAAAVLRGVHGRRRRQKQLRGLAAGAGVMALALLTTRLFSSLHAPPAARDKGAGLASRVEPRSAPELVPVELPPVRLRDGSVARPQGKHSQVRVREDGPGRTVLALQGTAQFDVVHDPMRLFRVETRGLAVEVLGTRFVVEEQGAQVRIAVQQGRVRVLWASHYDELGAGHSAVFLPEPTSAADLTAPGNLDAAVPSVPPLMEPGPGPASVSPTVLPVAGPVAPASYHATAGNRRSLVRSPRPVASTAASEPQPAPEPQVAPPPHEPESWQALAHEGQFEQAYRLAYGPPAEAAGPRRPPAAPPLLREREVVPSELLLLADVARLSHHPADAVAPLSRLLREHAADPRAPLAAFTLGRVLLDELGRPREAAQSFLRVQELDPSGPLSQDALAREVEAWSRAGEAASARARALQYVQKYPTGRRLRSVRHFGELL